MSISSSSTYSVSNSTSGATSKGFNGLASGIDTDSLVEQMLSGTQNKIDKQQGIKQQLLWQQEMYRDIISSINSFHQGFFDTAFDASSANNLASNDFFNSMISKISSGSEYLKIISSSPEANVGDMNVLVKQLAAAAKLESSQKLSSGKKVGIDISENYIKQFAKQDATVELSVGGRKVSIDLNGLSSTEEIVSKVKDTFSKEGINATVKLSNNKIVMTSDSQIKVTGGTDAGLSALGVSKDATSTNVSGGVHSLSSTTSPQTNTVSFNISFNGVSKQITLTPKLGEMPKEPNKNSTQAEKDAWNKWVEESRDAIVKELGKEIQSAFGGTYNEADGTVTDGYVQLLKDADGSYYLATDGKPGNSFTITGEKANWIGVEPGSTSNVNYATKLGELSGVAGGAYKFSINGVDFSFDAEDTLETMISTINSSSAGVRVSYSSLSDTLKIEASSSGSKYNITMSQEQGNLLSAIFGNDVIASGSSIASDRLLTNEISGTYNKNMATNSVDKTVSFSLNVNGTKHTYSIKGAKNLKDAINKVNAELKKSEDQGGFGGKIELTEDGVLKIHDDSMVVSFDTSRVDATNKTAVQNAQKKDLAYALGFSIVGKTNVADENTKLSSLNEASRKAMEAIAQSAGMTTGNNTTIASINAHADTTGFRFENGRLIASPLSNGKKPPAYPEVRKLFGNVKWSALGLGDGQMKGQAIQGQDAIVYINGIEIERSSNTFTVDGITMQLTKAVDWVDKDGNPATSVDDVAISGTSITTERDTDAIVDTMKKFVEEYNKMIDKLSGYTDADATYKKYSPLTDAQRKEMSDKEIELWEEKAKEGLLRNDGDVEAFLSQMRMALYTKPESSKFALYDIGIETGKWTDKGKLVFDEAAFRTALANDPDSIRNLFTDPDNGLAKQLTTIMDNAANLSTGSQGTLVQKAGMKGWSSEQTNEISQKLQSIEDKIKDLKSKYEIERQRYWNQFTSMEKYLSNMNTQSGWLAQQFSY